MVRESNPAARELLGETLNDTPWREVIARAFAPRADDGHDITLRDGRRVHLSTVPLGDQPGQIVLLTDISQTRDLQDKVHHYERLTSLGEMAAGLAHQIRTPLSAAMLYLGMLKRPERRADEVAALVEKTLGRLRHIEALVRDMMLLARADLDGGVMMTATELLCAAEYFVRPHVPGERIMLRLIDDAQGTRIRVQRELMLSAMGNLVNNAVQSIHERGTVVLHARRNDALWLDIDVKDDGCGIPADTLGRLGQPFFTTREGGTGLGIAVVNAVAKAHHGTLQIASTPGRGSTFTLRLPALDESAVRLEDAP
jgi:two-component system sensor histidine kinase FlrB